MLQSIQEGEIVKLMDFINRRVPEFKSAIGKGRSFYTLTSKSKEVEL